MHTVVRNGRNVIIEEWEFLMQGYTGCAFFDGRRIRIKFSLKVRLHALCVDVDVMKYSRVVIVAEMEKSKRN